MKTKITGKDLLFIFDLLMHQLRIVNNPDEYKNECRRLMRLIDKELSKIKVEINELGGTK